MPNGLRLCVFRSLFYLCIYFTFAFIHTLSDFFWSYADWIYQFFLSFHTNLRRENFAATSYLDAGRRIKDSGRPVYQKLLEIEKEIVREVARGDKPYLRKSTDRKAQISPLN